MSRPARTGPACHCAKISGVDQREQFRAESNRDFLTPGAIVGPQEFRWEAGALLMNEATRLIANRVTALISVSESPRQQHESEAGTDARGKQSRKSCLS